MSEREPTYEELRALRQQEWEAAQAKAAKQIADLHAELSRMPDVREAPSPDLPWYHRDIACAHCGGKGFLVKRWVTVNGIRHRAELRCLQETCEKVETWDWTENAWLK